MVSQWRFVMLGYKQVVENVKISAISATVFLQVKELTSSQPS